MKTLKDYNFKGKRVFVRCDFNVSLEEGKIKSDFRIKKALPTLRSLKEEGAKIIIGTHLGRPLDLSRKERKKYSTKVLKDKLEKLLGEEVYFSKKVVGRKPKSKIKKMDPGSVLLLENLRFNSGEQENDRSFSKKLAELADVYVNESFSVLHREHASIVGVPKFLPSFAGLNLKKEIEICSDILEDPQRPLSVIIGGAKVKSKIGVIEKFLDQADHILIGGKLISMILRVKGVSIGKSWPPEKIVESIKDLDLTNPKIHMPIDVLVSPDKTGDFYIRETAPGKTRKEEKIFDIGEDTVDKFGEIIKESKTVLWAGPMGVFEEEEFSKGTRGMIRKIKNKKDLFSVIGGGDTAEAIEKFDNLENFSFVSTGGSAMLEYLSTGNLVGLKPLR